MVFYPQRYFLIRKSERYKIGASRQTKVQLMNIQTFYEKYLDLVKASPIDPKAITDCLIDWYCHYFGEAALKNQHSALTLELGKFHPEDALYEDRTAYILNMILFSEQTSQDILASPYEVFCRDLLKTLRPELSATEIFFEPIHSVFSVKKSKKAEVQLIDLFSNKTIYLKFSDQSKEALAFLEKSLIQTILFEFEANFYFNPGCIFHPHGTLKTIQKFISHQPIHDELGGILLKDKTTVLKRLAATQLNHFRLSHVPPEKIYGQRLPLPT